ncbi:hypothetical protein [Occallatibacter riparius]|uniref:Uncharacterized protein n=1 Tax=Occallatibacter riparius TaxID=1002689 RepID=A0A9J7BMA2_9BACT|nr:hypothetical protein [Occallatibacter riparius]UWZ83803.1 hypothetical protein MOP44_24970 [Occallatibacter riparius]
MAMWLRELREQLLRAGVAPRHVHRYLTELREHWADLTAEEERAGRNRVEAEALALTRLGRVEDLARTMIEKRDLRSWTARAPWVVLGVGPVLGLLAAWSISLLILWSGWRWFLEGSPTPFIPLHGFATVYFGVGRTLYYTAPLLAGWAMILLAGRQRLQAVWPVILGSLVVALIGATGAVDVNQGAGDVGIRFFPVASQIADTAGHALLLFVLVTLPYVVWRWRNSRPGFEQQ